MGGPYSWFGRFVGDENLLPLPRVEPRLRANPTRNLVTVSTTLSRLPFSTLPEKCLGNLQCVRRDMKQGHNHCAVKLGVGTVSVLVS